METIKRGKVERHMDLLQDQIDVLNEKVDALHQMIEQLSSQTALILSEIRTAPSERNHPLQAVTSVGRYPYYTRTNLAGGLEHKDVLSDDSYPESETQSGERSLAPEIQVQRLTAQLTAAYNRIAALEEQLLSKRTVH
jgi:hypothetical protein